MALTVNLANPIETLREESQSLAKGLPRSDRPVGIYMKDCLTT